MPCRGILTRIVKIRISFRLLLTPVNTLKNEFVFRDIKKFPVFKIELTTGLTHYIPAEGEQGKFH
jgi:hypothetical protein